MKGCYLKYVWLDDLVNVVLICCSKKYLQLLLLGGILFGQLVCKCQIICCQRKIFLLVSVSQGLKVSGCCSDCWVYRCCSRVYISLLVEVSNSICGRICQLYQVFSVVSSLKLLQFSVFFLVSRWNSQQIDYSVR